VGATTGQILFDDTKRMDEDGERAERPSPGGLRGIRPAVLAGVAGGLIGASSSIAPAVAAAFGAGAGTFLIAWGRLRPLLFVVGAGVALTVTGLVLGRRRQSCRSPREFRDLRADWITGALAAFAVTYALGWLVIPRLIERL
jgi:hypothetical protein